MTRSAPVAVGRVGDQAAGRPPLRILYLLAGSELCGGAKVILRHADLLAGRGHRVTVAGPDPAPDWHTLCADYRQVPDFAPGHLSGADVVVATFWTTLTFARRAPEGQLLHFCQGFEWSFEDYREQRSSILDAYAVPAPAIAVAPHLAKTLRDRFRRPARVVPQPLEPDFRPASRPLPARPPRILVVGPWEIAWKGVATALRAVAELRRRIDCRLVRLSQWPQCEAERLLLPADEFHHHLHPREVPALMRSCDLLLAPSWEEEGFGLPALEAMASGVPVVASDVASYRGFARPAAELVAARDAGALASAAERILGEPPRWRRMREAGLTVAAGYREERVTPALEAAMFWAASGAWRREVPTGVEETKTRTSSSSGN